MMREDGERRGAQTVQIIAVAARAAEVKTATEQIGLGHVRVMLRTYMGLY